jgi:hypothetical protein
VGLVHRFGRQVYLGDLVSKTGSDDAVRGKVERPGKPAREARLGYAARAGEETDRGCAGLAGISTRPRSHWKRSGGRRSYDFEASRGDLSSILRQVLLPSFLV